MDDIERLDRAWGSDKIAMLVDGIIEVDGELFYGHSAFDQRCAAETSHDDFSDLIVEPAQLDRSIRAAIQRDHQVRMAMLLRTRMGLDEYEIEQLIQSVRPGYRLIERGIELVRRHERGVHQQLKRVRAQQGESDHPVCWRCMTAEVPQPGMECDECPEPVPNVPPRQRGLLRGTRIPGHPSEPYDPARRPDPAQMTPGERSAEIERLAQTQENPRHGDDRLWNDGKIIPIGLPRNAADIRERDRLWQKGK